MKRYQIISCIFMMLINVLQLYPQAQYNPKIRIEQKGTIGKFIPPLTTHSLSSSVDIPMYPSTTNQTELSIAVNPNDANKIIAGANTDPGQGAYYSTDGGKTWNGTDELDGVSFYGSDPALAWDTDGIAYFNYLDNVSGWKLCVKRSTDGGANYQNAVQIPTAGDPDKNHMAIDGGKIYVGWTDFSGGDFFNCFAQGGPFPVKFARSINNCGSSFTTYGAISGSTIGPDSSSFAQGVNIAVGPNHEVYTIWACYNSFDDCTINFPTWHESAIGFNKSLDSGATWGTATRILSITGIRAWWTHKNPAHEYIRVNGFPSMAVDRSGGIYNGYIYVVWADGRYDISDVLLSKSTNGGSSWSSPVRVNQDPQGNGRDQWFPWITVTTSGVINIGFYDSRNDPNNQRTETWVAQSLDGGVTFKDYKASDTSFIPYPIPGYGTGYMGDYIGIASTNGFSFPCWMDNRAGGIYQAFLDRFGTQKVTASVANGWNMLSVPNEVHDFANNAVWTGANSSAFTWEGETYVEKYPVANRVGYWVSYPQNVGVTYVGVPKDSFHIGVKTGWNMIGSLYSDINKSKITPVNTSILSDFFGYSNTYFFTDTIKARKGYWIKVNQDGELYMDNGSTGGGGSHPCSEQPPNPANVPQPPILASPANGSTDVSHVPTLIWNSSASATSYNLQGSTNPCFTTLAFNYSGLTTTSKQVDLSYYTTYYWRVNGSNLSGTSNWSSTWSFTTENAPPTNPCDTYSSMTPLDEFTVSDAKGNGQKLYVGNGGRGFALPFSDFELPPITPKGVFNARFNSGKFIESVPPGKGLNKLTIKVKDAVLPLTLSWVVKEPNKISYWISKPGKNNTTIKLSGSGNTVVESSKDGDLIIIARAIDPCPEENATIGAEQLEDLLTTPITYTLEQNSPNPFNPNTVIEYSLPEAVYVVLKVYNILGEEVQTLVNETQDVGYKAVRFNASNLPSGIYLYKLTAGAFTDVKKMILMK